MASRGYEVTVVTALPNYPFGKAYSGYGRFWPDIRNEDGVKVVRLPVVMAANRFPAFRIASFVSFVISSFIWLFFSDRHDVIIATVPPATVAPLGYTLSKIKKIPVIMSLYDIEPLRSFDLRGKAKIPGARYIIRIFMRLYDKADRIVVPVMNEYRILVGHGVNPTKIEIITHGVDIDKFLASSLANQTHKLAKIPGRKIFLYLGTIGVAHDLESILYLFSDHSIRDLPVELLIIGDGERAPECRKIIRENNLDNVKIFPSIPHEQVPSVLVQADVLVISLARGLKVHGAKLFDCLAAGKPVLANDSGVIKDIIKSIGNGWFFDRDNPESLYTALTDIIRRPERELAEMGLKGREYAKIHFNAKEKHDRWEQLFLEIAGEKGRRNR